MPPRGHNATIELIWQYGTIVFFEESDVADKQVKDYDKFNLRFPDGMRDAIAERAKKNGRSMNSEIVQILEDAISKDIAPEELEGISFRHADNSGIYNYDEPDTILKYIEKRTDEFKKQMIQDLRTFAGKK